VEKYHNQLVAGGKFIFGD